ncbi:hypothetical protein [Streptomyces broussonetiae]|uniref:Uncharacterized protein n=1 Tax=Streptomyces broussonetiae TaxID=2686304 RepID=A0A6I6N7L2_9ACTN|nr:hypothetical protein [Streptomyces broussonetiae]QHA08933.1 hypothetical protein GQF42_41895 [Streptomyces broussonetiae]
MKRRVVTVLAVVVVGLMSFALPAAARDGRGRIEANDWNVPLTNIGLL